MNRFIGQFGFCGLLATAVAIAAPVPPKLRLSEAQQIEPAEYRVNLSLDPNKDDFEGSIQIRIDVRKPTSVIWLNANRIAVRTASITAGTRKIAAKPLPETG